jgi:chromosome segregation ATPase
MKHLTILLAFASLMFAFCKSETKEGATTEAAPTRVPSGSLEAKTFAIDTTLGKSLSTTIAKLDKLPASVVKQHKEEIERHRAYLVGAQTKFNEASFSLLEWRDQIYRITMQQKEGKIGLNQASLAIDSLNALISNFSNGYEKLSEGVQQVDQQVSEWK